MSYNPLKFAFKSSWFLVIPVNLGYFSRRFLLLAVAIKKINFTKKTIPASRQNKTLPSISFFRSKTISKVAYYSKVKPRLMHLSWAGGVRARGGDLMPETIPMSGFWSCEATPGSGLTLGLGRDIWLWPKEAWYQFRRVRPSRLSESHAVGERCEVFICFNRHNPIL